MKLRVYFDKSIARDEHIERFVFQRIKNQPEVRNHSWEFKTDSDQVDGQRTDHVAKPV